MRDNVLVRLLAIAAATITSGTIVSAADMPVKARPVAPPVAVFSWTGCYVGISGGGNWGRNDDNFQPSGTRANDRISLSGGIAGGTLGCNYQFDPHFVIGIEGDFSWTNKHGSQPSVTPPFQHEVRERWLTTERARFGYAWNNWLAYATGGLAGVQVKVTDTNATTGVNASDTQDLWGWTVGGGVEYAFAGPWSAKLEYLYAQFPTKTFLNPNPLGAAFNVNGLHDHIVRVGLNYKFWGGH